MEFWLLTSKNGYNTDGTPTKRHKYDGKDTFCNGLKNDGLVYEHKIFKSNASQYNKLKSGKQICKLCTREEYNNKIMAGPGASPNEDSNVPLAIQAQSDIISSRIDKAEFDTVSGG